MRYLHRVCDNSSGNDKTELFVQGQEKEKNVRSRNFGLASQGRSVSFPVRGRHYPRCPQQELRGWAGDAARCHEAWLGNPCTPPRGRLRGALRGRRLIHQRGEKTSAWNVTSRP